MARIRSDYGPSPRRNFLLWLRSGDECFDRALIDSVSAPAPSEAERGRSAEVRRVPRKEEKVYRKAEAWNREKGTKLTRRLYLALCVVTALAVILLLLRTTALLPPFGEASNPANNEVSRRYIEQGMEETGAVNIVAGMILDYRAFDTLGESNVLFVAACTVIILLRVAAGDRDDAARRLELETDDRMYEPKDDLILQRIAAVLVPLVWMLGLYIILNGHLSPGGGFSGGTVLGAGLILYLNAFGFAKTERFFTYRTFRVISVTALTFYAVSKSYSFFTGANHLPSVITPGTPGMLFSAGLIPYLNIAVGLVVACTVYAFYTLFRKGDV